VHHSGSLRFHPRCYYRPDEHLPTEIWPAMIACVTDLEGRITGVHRTWLDPDGFDRIRLGKAPIDTPRRAMGDLLGNAVRFGAADDDVLVAGEGIETILSLRCVLPTLPMAAALSANHLAAMVLSSSLRRLYIARDADAAGGYAADPQFERKEAVRLLRLALSTDDGDPDTLAWAAIISAFMVGDSESEIEMADRAVALNPNSFAAWNSRGQVYRIAGLPEEALRSFERAVRVSPVDPMLHQPFTGMGRAFIELGRFDEAIVAGKKAQRQNPSYPPAYRCLVSAYAHLGRDTEAREAAARMLETDPAFTISSWIARSRQSNAKLLIEGLRKAGLPE
jgi:tetratricopeptide (TPR) repeat protein